MTTVINTPSRDVADNSMCWAVAIIVIMLALGVGFYFWLQYEAPVATTGDTNISVIIPAETTLPLQGGVVNQ